MKFGSKSTWLVAIPEGDRNLADLARRRKGGVDRGGWVELMNLKVIAVWASTLASLPTPVRRISFTQQIPPWWETEGRQQKAA